VTQVGRAKSYAQATAPLRVPTSYFVGQGGTFTDVKKPPPRNGSAEWSEPSSNTPPAQRPLSTPPPEQFLGGGAPSVGGAGALAASAALPAGWQAASSRTFGREYYFCQATGERVWSVEDAVGSAAVASAKEGKGVHALAKGSKAADWKEFYSKRHSQPYWVNTATNDRTWSMPAGFRK